MDKPRGKIPVAVYNELIASEYEGDGHMVERNVTHRNGRSAIVVHSLKLVVQVRRYASFSRKIGRGQFIEYTDAFPGYRLRLHFLVEKQSQIMDIQARKASLEADGECDITWEWQIESRPMFYGNARWATPQAAEKAICFILRTWPMAREQDKRAVLEAFNLPHAYGGVSQPPSSRIAAQADGLYLVVADTQQPIRLTAQKIKETIQEFLSWSRVAALQQSRLGAMAEGGLR